MTATGSSSGGPTGSVDPQRPVVDGTADERSPQEKRADMDELRNELGTTVEELAHRVDVPARVRARREETTAQVQQQVARARDTFEAKAPQAAAAVRERPAVFGAAALAVLLLLVRRARRRRNEEE